METLGDLSLPVALGLLAVLLVAGIWTAAITGLWFVLVATVLAVGVLTGLYLRSYAQRPAAAPASPRLTVEEPFEDPVEEADRIASREPAVSVATDTVTAPAPIAPPDPGSGASLVGNDSE